MEGNSSLPQPCILATPQQIGYINSLIHNGYRFELADNVKKHQVVKPKHHKLLKLVINCI